MSPEVQNTLIEITGDLIRERLIEEIKLAPFWSIIADESCDRAKRELLTIAIRYPSNKNGQWAIYEEPIAVLDIINDIKKNSDSEGKMFKLC